jgi:hypothetical protein
VAVEGDRAEDRNERIQQREGKAARRIAARHCSAMPTSVHARRLRILASQAGDVRGPRLYPITQREPESRILRVPGRRMVARRLLEDPGTGRADQLIRGVFSLRRGVVA